MVLVIKGPPVSNLLDRNIALAVDLVSMTEGLRTVCPTDLGLKENKPIKTLNANAVFDSV